MQKVFYKFKACDTKSIATAIIHLEDDCDFIVNGDNSHAAIVLQNCNDNLLTEALNQITTVESILENGVLDTNYSRYIWKLNPNFKENKTRLKLLRLLKPIGLFFLVRNITTKDYLTLNDIEFNTFKIKWKSIYNDLPFSFRQENNRYIISIDEQFIKIINTAIDKYVINDTSSHREVKDRITTQTLNKLFSLINE